MKNSLMILACAFLCSHAVVSGEQILRNGVAGSSGRCTLNPIRRHQIGTTHLNGVALVLGERALSAHRDFSQVFQEKVRRKSGLSP